MAPNNHTDHDSAARTTQGVSAMSQPDAWLFQPTRISIFFDLHEYCMFLNRAQELELMSLGFAFLRGAESSPAYRSEYDRVTSAYETTLDRFRAFNVDQDHQL